MLSEFKSFYKQVSGSEGNRCRYNIRLDTYGCGCLHNCSYCYARSLLSFRGLWDAENPRQADIIKLRRKINQIPQGTIIRIGGMTDCFQPCEAEHRLAYQAIKELNTRGIGYLIVTKSDLVAEPEYLQLFDRHLAHIQISVTCLDDIKAGTYEKASITSKRIQAIKKLQSAEIDVSIRLSPLVEDLMDFDLLNTLNLQSCIVEFLRVNTWIKKWMPWLDYSQYTLRESNYYHLPLEEKRRIISKIKIPELSICEDVTEHYAYWREHQNPNKDDCCNLKFF